MKLLGYLIPPWVLALIAAVALAGAFSTGWKVQGWRCAAAQTKALKQAQAAFEKQLAEMNRKATEYENDREQAREDSLEREQVIRTVYRDRVVPAGCEPDPAAVRVLGDAVDAANARASGEPGG